MSTTAGSIAAVVVDLDGTIIRTDSLLESLLVLLRTRPWLLALLPFWLIGGKARFKRAVSDHAPLDPAALPYDDGVIDYVRRRKAEGCRVVLATAADYRIAQGVADHLSLFDGVLASDGIRNMSGAAKLVAIRERLNDEPFEYVADAAVDLPIWEQARRAIAANTSERTRRMIEEHGISVTELSSDRPSRIVSVIRTLRMYQWVKNLLLFLPLILAHQVTDLSRVGTLALEFLAFCLCASGVYVVNDLLDLEADRQHPVKRKRPFASGALPLWYGAVLVPAFLTGAFALSMVGPIEFTIVLGLYVLLTMAYSLHLKRIVMLDVIILAGLYTVRIYAGGVGVGVEVSYWFMGFSSFIFLSLAFAKRFSELYRLRSEKKENAAGRGYQTPDIQMLATFGTVAGYLSVLVFALYLNSSDVTRLYTRPGLLWFICAILIYWISRLWLLAHRGKLDEDPIVFALTDTVSYIVIIAAAVLVIAAV